MTDSEPGRGDAPEMVNLAGLTAEEPAPERAMWDELRSLDVPVPSDADILAALPNAQGVERLTIKVREPIEVAQSFVASVSDISKPTHDQVQAWLVECEKYLRTLNHSSQIWRTFSGAIRWFQTPEVEVRIYKQPVGRNDALYFLQCHTYVNDVPVLLQQGIFALQGRETKWHAFVAVPDGLLPSLESLKQRLETELSTMRVIEQPFLSTPAPALTDPDDTISLGLSTGFPAADPCVTTGTLTAKTPAAEETGGSPLADLVQ